MKYLMVDGNIRVNSDYIIAVREDCFSKDFKYTERHDVILILTDQSKHRISTHDKHEDAMSFMNTLCEQLEEMKNVRFIDGA